MRPKDILLLNQVVDTAKQYFKDPERFEQAVRKIQETPDGEVLDMKMLYSSKPSSNFDLPTLEFVTAYPPSPSLPHSIIPFPFSSCALGRFPTLCLCAFVPLCLSPP